MSHVTGGGLAANLARVMPAELSATIDRATWTPAPVFDLVRQVGDVPLDDLERTLNCGVGMVALVAPDDADEAVRVLAEHDVRAWVAGEVTADAGGRCRPRRVASRLVTPRAAPKSRTMCAGTAWHQVALGLRQRPIRPVSPLAREPRPSARGSTLWGAAEPRRSRRRSPAT